MSQDFSLQVFSTIRTSGPQCRIFELFLTCTDIVNLGPMATKSETIFLYSEDTATK
jgi:hypothetical protein